MTTPSASAAHTLALQGLQFLAAVRHDDTSAALALLNAHPAITTASIRTACAAGEQTAAARWLQARPTCVHESLAPDHTAPLIYAAMSRLKRARGVPPEEHVALVRQLLDAGADPNASVAVPDSAGRMPVLYFPCVENNVEVARLLLERGAAPTDGESLYHAAQHDHRDVLALLHEFGADLSRGPDGAGNTPLHFLVSHRASNPLAPTVIRGLQWLLEHGADPNVPLAAIGDGQRASQRGETPLHRAAANGHDAGVLALLVAHGAAVDATRDDGATPYALAVRSGNAGAAVWLASNGADRARCTPNDRFLGACLTADTAEARALLHAHPELVTALNDDDAGTLLQALTDGHMAAVQLMLSLGWPLTPESEWGGTALHWAAWNGQQALVRLLLARGAPVNVRDSRYGSSPIAWAAHGSRYCAHANDTDYPAIVHRLLDAGATRAESFNQWGESPESLARPSVVAVLQARGFLDEGG